MEIKIPLGYTRELGRKIKRSMARGLVEDRWVAVRGKGLLRIESLIGS